MLALYTAGAVVAQVPGRVTVRRTEALFGETVEVFITAGSEEMGYINLEEAFAEIRRVERLISTADPGSEISRINAMAGVRPVQVAPELFNLLRRANLIADLTSGSFDITVAALDTLWRFDGSMRQIPDRNAIAALLPSVGYGQLVLDPGARTVFLPRKDMKISLAAIAKGYAADRAKALMQSKEVPGGMINAGGVISVWGSKASGEKWMLGIADPKTPGKFRKWLPLIESSVGMVQVDKRFVKAGGRTYGEVLDPHTGMPVEGIRQVIVLARTAEFSDALATAICVLGPAEGIRLVEQLGDTEAVIIDSEGLMFWTRGLLLDPGP